MFQQHIKQYWQYLTKQPKQTQRITAVVVVLLIASIGTILLIGSHAASPYASVTADQGTLTGGAASQSCSGSSDGSCVVFGGGGGSGPTYYLSEAGGTVTGDGTVCDNAGNTYSASYFNTSSNWSSTASSGKIYPGVTIALCGTIDTTLTAQGSGVSGNPITIA